VKYSYRMDHSVNPDNRFDLEGRRLQNGCHAVEGPCASS